MYATRNLLQSREMEDCARILVPSSSEEAMDHRGLKPSLVNMSLTLAGTQIQFYKKSSEDRLELDLPLKFSPYRYISAYVWGYSVYILASPCARSYQLIKKQTKSIFLCHWRAEMNLKGNVSAGLAW